MAKREQAERWLEKVKARGAVGRRVKAIAKVEAREASQVNGWLKRVGIVFQDGSEVVVDYGVDGYTILEHWGDPTGPSRFDRGFICYSCERDDLPDWLRQPGLAP